MNMDQAIADLIAERGPDPVMKRIVRVTNSHTELFDAASAILGWMRGLHAKDRPIAKFNRLQDAINNVREAHQMEIDHG